MLSSIGINDAGAANLPRQDTLPAALPAPLTARHVEEETDLNADDQHALRGRNGLFWFESKEIASLDARITFINNVTDRIFHTIPAKDTPITLISLGAGGLLTEAYIHQRLQQANYTNIAWRIIDVLYSDKFYNKFLKQFKDEVGGHCRAFTTEQAYFKKAIGSGSLVEDDKVRGEIIVLAINPPTTFKDSVVKPGKSAETLEFFGMPQSDYNKANAIFLLLGRDKSLLDRSVKGLSEGKTLIWENGLKCCIDNNGKHTLIYASSDKGSKLFAAVSKHLSYSDNMDSTTGLKNTLEHIDKRLDEFLMIVESDGIIGRKYLTSDYDASLLNLKDGFAGRSHPALFASFDKNVIEIKNQGAETGICPLQTAN
ncbi:hypothetical protein ABK905_25835 [Acerihabitans sp. KWT182]|uniref:Uncharacterized protein n=1 Tax=Acerihabitans sp. KWT182 TaxID=3157919 RepID=A0AAU7Q959_9GAMM